MGSVMFRIYYDHNFPHGLRNFLRDPMYDIDYRLREKFDMRHWITSDRWYTKHINKRLKNAQNRE